MHRKQSINRVTKVAATVLLAALLAPAAFGAEDDKKHNDAFVAGDAAESRIAKQVRHELLMLPYYGVFDDLAFRVDGSTVTLLGAVTKPTLKSDAERAAKKVEGVTNVINEVEVLPLAPMDDQIRMAEFRAIYGDPSISIRYGYRSITPIHILVKNGHVTLEGIVGSQGDKDLINVRANGVPNVFSVTNNLQVEKN